MRIELAKLETTEGKFAHAYAAGELELNDDRVRLAEPPRVSGRMDRQNRKVRVEGHIQARAGVDCDRCLKPIDVPVDANFNLDYVTAEGYESVHTNELASEDLALSVFDGLAIDLDEIAREQVLLAVPSQVVCRDNCKGLCATCGADRNVSDCGCEVSQTDPRWARLREIANRKS